MTETKAIDKGKDGQAMSLADRVWYCALLAVVRLISCLPFRAIYVLSDIMFVPFYHVVRYRRRIVRKNLTGSFPDKSSKEIILLEKKFYRFFVDMFLESCKLMLINEDEIRRRMKFVNPELVHELLGEGKTVAAYLGHFGNWEWVSSAGLWFKETTIVQVYRKMNSRAAGKIMYLLRCRMGHVCVDMHSTARFMSTAARDNKQFIYGLLADQTPKWKDSKYFVPFLNHSTPVIIGTEKAAKRYCHAAVFIDIKRVRRGFYEAEFIPLGGDLRALADYELTRLYFQHLEVEILRQPELYLWSHRRFRNARVLKQKDIHPDGY